MSDFKQQGAKVEIIFKNGISHKIDIKELFEDDPSEFDIDDQGVYYNEEGEFIGDDSYNKTDEYQPHLKISFPVYLPIGNDGDEKKFGVELEQDDHSAFGFDCTCTDGDDDHQIKSIRYFVVEN